MEKKPLPWQRDIALAIFSHPPLAGKTWLINWLVELDRLNSLPLAKAIMSDGENHG